MEFRVLATIYALVFVGIEMIWLVTIRNRYVILISCATILVGVQGLTLILVRDRFHMGNGYLLEYLGKLVAIDGLFLLSLWVLLYSTFQYKSPPGNIENKTGPFSFLVRWLIAASSAIETIITTRWFWTVLSLLFIFWCIINGLRSCKSFPDG